MAMKRAHRPAERPSPAWTLTLMLGRLSGDTPETARLGGWVTQTCAAVKIEGEFDYTPAGDAQWARYGETLTAEARAAGFEPFWASKVEPSGPAAARWLAAFLDGLER
jgi:hypothetical protein